MINSNLHFLNTFLEKQLGDFASEEYEKNWSSELEVHYNSRDYKKYFESGDFEIKFQINPKIMRLGGTEKLNLYIILRCLTLTEHSSFWKFVLLDLEDLYKQRSFTNNFQYSYLKSLNDSQFAYEIDSILFNKKSRRDWFRKFNSKTTIGLTFTEILSSEYLRLNPIFKSKTRPKKLQRHKGYRDHGSLGSEFSKTLKQQSTDYTIREAEERRRIEKLQAHDLLMGLCGWI